MAVLVFLSVVFVRVPAVVPWYPAVVPLRGHKRQYRSAAVVPAVTPQQYYRWLTRSLPRRFEGSFSVSDCAVPRCGSSAAVPPFLRGSTTRFPLSLYPSFCATVPPKGAVVPPNPAVVPLSPTVLPPQGSCFVAPFPCFFHLSGSTARVRAEHITVGFSPSYKRGSSSPMNLIL